MLKDKVILHTRIIAYCVCIESMSEIFSVNQGHLTSVQEDVLGNFFSCCFFDVVNFHLLSAKYI